MKFTTSIALLLLAPVAATSLFLRDTAGGDSFSKGLTQGKRVAERMWRDAGSDCSNIWSFRSDVRSAMSWDYPDKGNWRNRSYNRGARSGADDVVLKYEEKCLESNTDECTGLGESAAAEIAYGYCPPPADGPQAMKFPPNYKKTCRQVAYGICEGNVGSNVKANGCRLTTRQIFDLQRQCKDQVDSMTSDDDDRVIIPVQPVTNSRCSRKKSCSSCLSGGKCAWVAGDGISGGGRCYDSCDDPNYPDSVLWICWDGEYNTPRDVCSKN